MHLEFVDPDSLLSSHHVAVLLVGMEELGESARSVLLDLGGELGQIACGRSRPEVTLINFDYSKLVVFDKLEAGLEILFGLYLVKDLPNANPQMMSAAIVTSGTCSRK